MTEVNFELVNEFLKSDTLEGHKLILKAKCLQADAHLKELVQEKNKVVEQLNVLQVELNNKENEIISTNGSQRAYVDMINDIVTQEQGE